MLTGLILIRPKRTGPQLLIVAVSLALGNFSGQIFNMLACKNYFIAHYMGDGYLDTLPFRQQLVSTRSMEVIFHSTVVHYAVYGIIFYLHWAFHVESTIQNEKIRRVATEKKAIESHLQALRAQIEPHFLFNTLSNILNLFDTDIDKGITMQQDLMRYLESSLPKISLEATTLGQEIEMIQSYLNIYKVRLGDRLNYAIDMPENLCDLEFPPMLIQPLVENAIKHGIDPKIEGGDVCIRVDDTKNVFRLEVADTGVGLKKNSTINVGLSNIRERIKMIYGKRGKLILKENKPAGLKAVIEVAYA